MLGNARVLDDVLVLVKNLVPLGAVHCHFFDEFAVEAEAAGFLAVGVVEQRVVAWKREIKQRTVERRQGGESVAVHLNKQTVASPCKEGGNQERSGVKYCKRTT